MRTVAAAIARTFALLSPNHRSDYNTYYHCRASDYQQNFAQLHGIYAPFAESRLFLTIIIVAIAAAAAAQMKAVHHLEPMVYTAAETT